MADQVAHRIVEAVASRRLASGERLIETELATALHVSRVPIREAIRTLASQGIVVANPRRGARVATFDAGWARQLHAARVAIERLGAHPAVIVQGTLHRPCTSRGLRDRDRAPAGKLAGCQSRRHRFPCGGLRHRRKSADGDVVERHLAARADHVFDRDVSDVDFDRVVKEHRVYIDTLLHETPAGIDEEIDRHVAGLQTFKT